MHRPTRPIFVALVTLALLAAVAVVSSAISQGPMDGQDRRADNASTPSRQGSDAQGQKSEISKKSEVPQVRQRPDPLRAATKRPRLTAPLPRTASSVGKMVNGFPIEILAPVTGSSIRSSGVSSAGSRLQVSLVATNTRPPESVLKFYRHALTGAGFVESLAPAVGGSTATGFVRAGESLIVRASEARSGLTTYSVFGTLRADTPR